MSLALSSSNLTLTEQLTANRTLTEALKNQASNVKVSLYAHVGEGDADSRMVFLVQGQALHNGVGFPLRRFNIDITDGMCSSVPRLCSRDLTIALQSNSPPSWNGSHLISCWKTKISHTRTSS